jgi:hypothetical protein
VLFVMSFVNIFVLEFWGVGKVVLRAVLVLVALKIRF